MEEIPPCKVCGGTDLNLVDGFYYCTECGTQDVTVRETIIEYHQREDGTLAYTQAKKIVLTGAEESLSSEWYKWHVYNFMLAGLADELVAVGADAAVKPRLLWIWSKYVRELRKDESAGLDLTTADIDNIDSGKVSNGPKRVEEALDAEQNETAITDHIPVRYRIRRLNMRIIQAMMYAALNIAESEIQAGDLRRFIKEDRISCKSCLRFVPKELNYKKVDPNDRFLKTANLICDSRTIRGYTMTLFKELKLGKPPSANLHKLVSRYITELCLPAEFRALIFSLMNFIPVSLEMEYLVEITRTPDYEGVAMAYIIIGLKMCFGLDDLYENFLSDMVAQYNNVNGYSKVYKYGLFIDGTDRLFSFREWMIHMEFKKQIIAKYYLPVAIDFNVDIDDQVFISHTQNRARKNYSAVEITDTLMMQVLEKLEADVEAFKTPKIVFPSSLTPLATYTDILLTKLDDPELKELLGEDFSQYSIKYVTTDMEINEMQTSGVFTDNYVVSEETKKRCNFGVDKKLVYVRNCENENWLVTKPPMEEHVKTDDGSDVSNEESTRTSISESINTVDCVRKDSQAMEYDNTDTIASVMEVDDQLKNIFDDDFNVNDEEQWHDDLDTNTFQINDKESIDINYTLMDESFSHVQIDESNFDPEIFDKQAAIERLLEIARKQYRIKDTVAKPRAKRKLPAEKSDFDFPPKPKKPRTSNYGEAKKHVNTIIETYRTNLYNKSKYAIDVNSGVDGVNMDGSDKEPELDENNEFSQPVDLEPDIIKEPDTNEEPKQNENYRTEKENVDKSNHVHNDSDDDNEDVDNEKTVYKHFDENVYDTKQLYLKVKMDANEVIKETKEEDTEIIELFRRKEKEILEAKKKQNENETENDSKENPSVGDSKGSDDEIDLDDIPLSELFKELQNSQRNEDLSLINRDEYRPYNYWVLHYKMSDPPDGFDVELNRRFSRSFTWVMRLCTDVIGCPTRSLYLQIMNLEKELKCALKNPPRQ